MTDKKNTIEWVPLSAIGRDERVNTRPIDYRWVERHVPIFDLSAIGIPVVSRRDDGTIIFMDGQNRGALLRRVGRENEEVLCRVWYGLSLAEEADLFLRLNDSRQVKTIYNFLARVTSQEPVAVALDELVRRHGWTIDSHTGSGQIIAVDALERIYNGDRRLNRGEAHLDAVEATISTATTAWGHRQEAANGSVLRGIGLVFLRYGDAVSQAELARKLAAYPGGPGGLHGDARGLKALQGGSVSHNVADVVVKTYNRRRSSRRLPAWRE